MKKLILFVLLLSWISNIQSQEITLFDSDGAAIAYINYSEESTIFLFDGNPVAFLENDGADICIIGYNGAFLGWFDAGIIYNIEGYVVGAKEGATTVRTQREPRKDREERLPRKPRIPRSPRKPNWKLTWGYTKLTEFLNLGKSQ